MLRITIPAIELYDESKNEFITHKGQTLQLEHSLVSLSKWESKWKKPFLSKGDKTIEETLDYIKCMNTTQNVDDMTFDLITDEDLKKVRDYIDDKMTATTFKEDGRPPNREVVTAELIYYWMIAAGVPFECQKWHLNRLLTLINVCGIKSGKPKKMSKKELASRNASLNAARKKSLKTGG